MWVTDDDFVGITVLITKEYTANGIDVHNVMLCNFGYMVILCKVPFTRCPLVSCCSFRMAKSASHSSVAGVSISRASWRTCLRTFLLGQASRQPLASTSLGRAEMFSIYSI